MFTALKQAWPFLALLGLAVVAVAATRPKGDADVAYLADYFKQAPERSWAAVVVKLNSTGDVIWNRADEPSVEDGDYVPAPMPPKSRRVVTIEVRSRTRRKPLPLPFEWDGPDDILPPAPAGMDAGSPLWRELVVETAVPTLSDDEVRDIAARWLREARDEARAEMAGAR